MHFEKQKLGVADGNTHRSPLGVAYGLADVVILVDEVVPPVGPTLGKTE